MKAPEPRLRLNVKVGAAIVLVLVALGCAVVFSAIAPKGSTGVVARPSSVATSPSAVGIFVHILGAVNQPGLYQLREGDRGVDAIASAGGFTKDADQSQLNLARVVADGEQIVVPVVGATPTAAPGEPKSAKVNLNTADETELETLPRVGPAMAARIIAWREQNGRFTSVEDLMSVTGVGPKTFEGLKDLITI